MFWIFESGEEEGLTRGTDEKLDRLSFESESVRRRASGPPQGFSSACMGEARREVWMDWMGCKRWVFNGRLRGGAVLGWQCTFCSAAHCWNTRFSCY